MYVKKGRGKLHHCVLRARRRGGETVPRVNVPAMRLSPARQILLIVVAILFPASVRAGAGDVEIAPFAGLQYGGSFNSAATGRHVSFGAGLQYGGTVDVGINENWDVELLYARQSTDLSSLPRIDLTIERYMAGVREEKGDGPARFLGVFLLGLTRFAPGLDGSDADERFTAALGLGVRAPLSPRFGLRADARAYYTVVTSGGGTACVNGACLFVFGSSGILQGDVTAAMVFTF
jgi:hypothetical protein